MQGARHETIVTLWRVSRNAADAAKSARPKGEVRQEVIQTCLSHELALRVNLLIDRYLPAISHPLADFMKSF
jgi:hypothetical protein